MGKVMDTLGNYGLTNPYKFYTAIATAIFMAGFGAASWPTSSEKKAYEERREVAKAYAAALPKQGDTLETVVPRMTGLKQKYGELAVTQGVNGKNYCENKFLQYQTLPSFKGNQPVGEINPDAYFQCLRNNPPLPQGVRSPEQQFKVLTFGMAPVLGLILGGFVGLTATTARRKYDASSAPKTP